MKLSDLTIESVKEFISGDNQLTPGLSGPNILKLFNQVGFKDVYKYQDGGMPNKLSRNQYVLEKLYEINGTKQMINLIEIVFDPRHFAKDNSKNINDAVEKINPLITQDGYRLEEIEGKYKIIGADLPEEVEVEIYFEEIQEHFKETHYIPNTELEFENFIEFFEEREKLLKSEFEKILLIKETSE